MYLHEESGRMKGEKKRGGLKGGDGIGKKYAYIDETP